MNEACEACAEQYREKGELAPCGDCEHGPPEVVPEARLSIHFIRKAAPMAMDGFGGINMGNIQNLLNLWEVPANMHQSLTEDLIFYLRERAEAKGHGK